MASRVPGATTTLLPEGQCAVTGSPHGSPIATLPQRTPGKRFPATVIVSHSVVPQSAGVAFAEAHQKGNSAPDLHILLWRWEQKARYKTDGSLSYRASQRLRTSLEVDSTLATAPLHTYPSHPHINTMAFYGETVQEDYSSETFQTGGFGGEETFQETQEEQVTDTYIDEPDGQVFEEQNVQDVEQVTETESFF